MNNSTKDGKKRAGFSFKSFKGLVVLFACIIGALTIIIVPTVTANANTNDRGGTSGGSAGGGGTGGSQFGQNQGGGSSTVDQPTPDGLPSGNDRTLQFTLNYPFNDATIFHEVILGTEITGAINIGTVNALTSWEISGDGDVEFQFFPNFVIIPTLAGEVTITLTANRSLELGGGDIVRVIRLNIVA